MCMCVRGTHISNLLHNRVYGYYLYVHPPRRCVTNCLENYGAGLRISESSRVDRLQCGRYARTIPTQYLERSATADDVTHYVVGTAYVCLYDKKKKNAPVPFQYRIVYAQLRRVHIDREECRKTNAVEHRRSDTDAVTRSNASRIFYCTTR